MRVESSKHMGCEKTNFSAETVGTEQLRWEVECGNVMSPFVILGVTGFGDSWGEGQGTIAIGKEAQSLGRKSACLVPSIPKKLFFRKKLLYKKILINYGFKTKVKKLLFFFKQKNCYLKQNNFC